MLLQEVGTRLAWSGRAGAGFIAPWSVRKRKPEPVSLSSKTTTKKKTTEMFRSFWAQSRVQFTDNTAVWFWWKTGKAHKFGFKFTRTSNQNQTFIRFTASNCGVIRAWAQNRTGGARSGLQNKHWHLIHSTTRDKSGLPTRLNENQKE